MSTLNVIDGEKIMITKGATDVILPKLSHIKVDGKERKITSQDIKCIENENNEFSRKGMRVLAIAYKKVNDIEKIAIKDEEELVFLGAVAMVDPPRKESQMAVNKCKKAGIKPIMITGDYKLTAASIAKRIGILDNEKEACEGSEIDKMSDDELKKFVENISVYARVSPEHKIRIVKAWQAKGNIVAMTGDGVNDAPALNQADIGIAMGITGSEVSKDASSMVLADDNFSTIVKAIENGRNIYQNIKNAIQFLLSGNFAGILAVLFASVALLPVPFAPVHLLFINLLTDSLPAIALGFEKGEKDIMNRKPRRKEEGIMTKDFLGKVGIEGLVIAVMTMTAFFIGYRQQNEVLASTMAFGTLCMGRLFHGYNCKSEKPIIFSGKLFDNKFLVGAFLVGAVLMTMVLEIPGLQRIFKVQTLEIWQLLCIYGLASMNFVIIQFIKYVKCKIVNCRNMR